MRSLFKILVAVLVAVTALPAVAGQGPCDKGDELIGPNCVHTKYIPLPKQLRPFAEVYRVEDGKKVVVWSFRPGAVYESTAEKLGTVEWTHDEEEDRTGYFHYTYTWDGKAYSGRTRAK